jgi:hypothetical protein
MRNGRWCRRWLGRTTVCAAVVVASAVVTGASAGATIATPTVAAATGGAGVPVLASTAFDLADVGYESSEYILSGTANAYTSAAPLTPDGKWTATTADRAPYVTRAVVYRPKNPKKFNGTALVEWLNVSGGVDANPDWVQTHTQLIRDGYAWVGVSAQAVGLNATKSSDPARYAALSHPGDSFAYDMYSQAGEAVRDNPMVLGGLKPKHVLAVGESQSAGRLVTYLNAVAPTAKVYDGYLVHSRGAAGSALSQAPLAVIASPNPTAIRDDLDVPVFVYETETDVAGSNLGARQDDTKMFRLWEGAGTSHYDTYGLVIGNNDVGDGQGAVQLLAAMQNPTNDPVPGIITCSLAINTGPMHWELDAVVDHLNKWVANGTQPPKAPRLDTTATSPVAYAFDGAGNATGGVRSPQVDVPIAQLGGVKNSGEGSLGMFCRLFGTTVPMSATDLAARYPNRRAFVTRWNKAVDRALKAGYLVPEDAKQLRDAAAQSQIGA